MDLVRNFLVQLKYFKRSAGLGTQVFAGLVFRVRRSRALEKKPAKDLKSKPSCEATAPQLPKATDLKASKVFTEGQMDEHELMSARRGLQQMSEWLGLERRRQAALENGRAVPDLKFLGELLGIETPDDKTIEAPNVHAGDARLRHHAARRDA
jgi:hypothetical protein